jgi:hypothetical protein
MARDAATSFLLSEGYTRKALEEAGFKVVLWRDDRQIALGTCRPNPDEVRL